MSSVEKTVFDKKMEEYIQSTKVAHTHAGKLIAFSELMKSIFGVSSFEIVQNVKVFGARHHKTHILKDHFESLFALKAL